MSLTNPNNPTQFLSLTEKDDLIRVQSGIGYGRLALVVNKEKILFFKDMMAVVTIIIYEAGGAQRFVYPYDNPVVKVLARNRKGF